MRLVARNLYWRAGGADIVRDVSLEVARGEFVGVIGPNGSGKSSLLAMLAGLRRPRTGYVLLDGEPILGFKRHEVARRLALVEQQAETSERMTARQSVELGRIPHLAGLSGWTERDVQAVEKALAAVDMADKAERLWHTLSGGERQRLHIARALAQGPDILLLDEPTNHLDIGHQLGLLELVRSQGLTVVAALHDLNHAAMFCDRIAVMDGGCLIAIGPPREVLTPAVLSRVFAIDPLVTVDENGLCHVRMRLPRARKDAVSDA